MNHSPTPLHGIYTGRGCEHPTIAAAMECLIPDGRTFIRAWDKGVLRSLNDDELEIFIFELGDRALRQGR